MQPWPARGDTSSPPRPVFAVVEEGILPMEFKKANYQFTYLDPKQDFAEAKSCFS